MAKSEKVEKIRKSILALNNEECLELTIAIHDDLDLYNAVHGTAKKIVESKEEPTKPAEPIK